MTNLTPEEHKAQMESMKAFDEQMPCVGIFWYDSEEHSFFGVRKKELTPKMVEVAAEKGMPLRTTVSEMGPLLLSRIRMETISVLMRSVAITYLSASLLRLVSLSSGTLMTTSSTSLLVVALQQAAQIRISHSHS